MRDVVKVNYTDDLVVSFTEQAWFNATEVAERYSKRPVDWLNQDGTKEYLDALAGFLKCEPKSLLKTRRGNNGGTWMHPRLAVPFARWLDVRFGVWCDEQIHLLLNSKHPHYDWKRVRSEATSSFKVMNQVLKLIRDDAGKESAPHHFSNEARLVNWALTGEFKGVDRDALSVEDLDLLAKLEERNAVYLTKWNYEQRKALLHNDAAALRAKHLPQISGELS